MSEHKHKIKWLEKLKSIKHIEIYIAIIFIVVILLIYLSNQTTKTKKKTTTNEHTVTAYVTKMESDLKGILSDISGVSNVNVMISLNLSELDVKDNNIVMSSFPPIKGVLVTAKGVKDTETKLKVLHAIEAVLDVTNGNIEILSSE